MRQFGGIALFFLLVFSRRAIAHSPLAGSVIARILPGWIDLEVSLNESDALALCRECTSRDVPLRPLSIRANQVPLNDTGYDLFRLTVGGRKVQPEDSLASLNVERDMIFRVRYQRPPGVIRFRANYMTNWSEKGANSLLLVLASTNDVLIGQKLLTKDSLEYEVADPATLQLPGFGGAMVPELPQNIAGPTNPWFAGFKVTFSSPQWALFGISLWAGYRTRRDVVRGLGYFGVGLFFAMSALMLEWIQPGVASLNLAAAILLAGFAAVQLIDTFWRASHRFPGAFILGLANGVLVGKIQPVVDIGDRPRIAAAILSFLGVLAAQSVCGLVTVPVVVRLDSGPKFQRYARPAIALVVALLTLGRFVLALRENHRLPHPNLSSVQQRRATATPSPSG